MAIGCAIGLVLFAWRLLRQEKGSAHQKLQSLILWASQMAHLLPRIGSVGKCKVALGYFQVVLVMPEVFSLELPQEYHEM